MYVKITNGSVETYPYSVGQLRRDNPNVSFPKQISEDVLESYGVFPVNVVSEPSFDNRTQTLSQNDQPYHENNQWNIGWTVKDKTSNQIAQYDEIMANTNRDKRNAKLTKTDFYALSDVTMSAEMATYRQALRDLPNHSNWPNLNIEDWPVEP